ncbi:kynureninase [Azohydromonas aeria]|uniref:kynureninase n=1 Tax=Azohydromonas aeria TaxID=2590212 RepID=UPI0012F88A80|nr:aminotransferase class V-fold PLP-dependent enzyme [Azohydromonas aeria]
MPITRDDCLHLDARDALAPLREAFELPEGVVYLDGHALGALPRGATARALEVVRREGAEGPVGTDPGAGGIAPPRRLGDRLAPFIGAGPGEVLVTDAASPGLPRLLGAMLRLRNGRRRAIVAERDNFPAGLHAAQGRVRGLRQAHELRLVDTPADLPAALDDDAAVLLLTHVDRRSGALHDMAALTQLAHARGALALWDVAHSAGVLPLDLPGTGADAAVGCTCKYLNGGPGAPAFLWLAPRRHGEPGLSPPGGWGHAEAFAEPLEQPHTGSGRFPCGAQDLISQTLVECGLAVFERTDLARIRAKSLALTDLFIALVEQRCAAHPLTLLTPREHARRGGQVSWRHPEGHAVMRALIDRGVIGDGRGPGLLRFGFAPLYTRFIDVWDAVQALCAVLDGGEWREERFRTRWAVT